MNIRNDDVMRILEKTNNPKTTNTKLGLYIKIRRACVFSGKIHSLFSSPPHDYGKGIAHGIQRLSDIAKTVPSLVDEWKAVSHVIERFADLINAGFKRMMANSNQGHHLQLSEVLRPIGHYLLERVDSNGDGTVSRAEVSHAAAYFNSEASEVWKIASAILRGLRPILGMYIKHEIPAAAKGLFIWLKILSSSFIYAI